MADESGRRPIPARNLALSQKIARTLASHGISPNMVSVLGLLAGVASGIALGLTSLFPDAARLLWGASALLVGVRGLSNMFDGMIAVECGQGTRTGIFWNELPDRISDVALLAGAGYSLGGSPLAGWLAACLALVVTYTRALGVLAGAPADFRGPFAKQQRMFSVAGLALVLALSTEAWRFAWGPGGAWGPMSVLLWVMVPGAAWTALRRVRTAARLVRQADHQ